MYERSITTKSICLINYQLRFDPIRRKVKELISKGDLGQIQHIDISLLVDSPSQSPTVSWRSILSLGGGLLNSYGVHQIDLVRWWIGDITRVCGVINTFDDISVSKDKLPVSNNDYCNALLQADNGCVVSIAIRRSNENLGDTHIFIQGDHASLFLDNFGGLMIKQHRGAIWQSIVHHQSLTSCISCDIWSQAFTHYASEIVQALQSGYLPKGATFFDGLCAQAIQDAIFQSNAGFGWINCTVSKEPNYVG